MGVDKSTLQNARGRYLLEEMIDTLLTRFDEVAIVRRDGTPVSFALRNAFVVADLPGADGPLCGICSGLKGAKGYVFVTACDMPNISIPVIDTMIGTLRQNPGVNICAGMAEGVIQPFHAVYHTDLFETMLPCIGHTSPKRFILGQRHILLPDAVLRSLSPDLALFANLNRPEVYLRHIAQEKMKKKPQYK
jgi:molybdopterin-guanine dinucleotide biosynthesis protein A